MDRQERYRHVLLGGGEIRDYARVAARIGPGAEIICADSGYRHCAPLGVAPSLLVGDFDSLREPPEEIPRITLPAEKDVTDLIFAVDTAVARGGRRLLLAGALGGRLDHTLGNIQCLARLSGQGVEACLTDGCTDLFAVTNRAIWLPARADCYFSVLSLTEKSEGVRIRGAKYPLEDHTLTYDQPLGVSNEFPAGEQGTEISVRSGTLLVMVVPRDGSPQ